MNNISPNFDINNKTKRNHIVPQVYLRHFRKSKKDNIWTYDKTNNNLYVSSISNVNFENKLYVIDDTPYTSYMSWEDYYTKNVDDTINDIFNEIVRNTECVLNIHPICGNNLKEKLINVISHQMLRTHEKIYSFYDKYPKELDMIFQDERIKKYKNQNDVDKLKRY